MKTKNEYANLADLLVEVVPKVMQALREQMRQERGTKLTVPQFRVLAAVNRGICHNKEIGDVLGVSEAAISRMIDGLVKDKYIKKEACKTDRRQSVLSLTLDGEKYFNFVKTNARKRLKNKLEVLPVDQAQIIIQGLETLQKNLELLNVDEKSRSSI